MFTFVHNLFNLIKTASVKSGPAKDERASQPQNRTSVSEALNYQFTHIHLLGERVFD